MGNEMKLEVEITEAEIKSAIERKIRVAIADEVNGWTADNFIKAQVKKHWREVADKEIQRACADSDLLRGKIMAALEAKLKGQLTAMMRVKK